MRVKFPLSGPKQYSLWLDHRFTRCSDGLAHIFEGLTNRASDDKKNILVRAGYRIIRDNILIRCAAADELFPFNKWPKYRNMMKLCSASLKVSFASLRPHLSSLQRLVLVASREKHLMLMCPGVS